MSSAASLDMLIKDVLDQTPYRSNPYFQSLRDGQMSFEDFLETQIQFYYAVVFFARPMSVLASRIPAAEHRVEILRNVWEEHGEGDPAKSHGATFQEFLSRLGGIKPEEIQRRALWPEIQNFNSALAGTCALDDYVVGASMLGIIERMFCEISNWIGRGVIERGWLRQDQMIHYNLHEVLDVRHSEDFFNVLRPAWEKSAQDRHLIAQGLRAGATVFNQLYRGLHESRGRRIFSDEDHPTHG